LKESITETATSSSTTYEPKNRHCFS